MVLCFLIVLLFFYINDFPQLRHICQAEGEWFTMVGIVLFVYKWPPSRAEGEWFRSCTFLWWFLTPQNFLCTNPWEEDQRQVHPDQHHPCNVVYTVAIRNRDLRNDLNKRFRQRYWNLGIIVITVWISSANFWKIMKHGDCWNFPRIVGIDTGVLHLII